MFKNTEFNFQKTENSTLELPFSEHIEELRQRLFHIFWIILFLTCLSFFEVKYLVKILELEPLFYFWNFAFSFSFHSYFSYSVKTSIVIRTHTHQKNTSRRISLG